MDGSALSRHSQSPRERRRHPSALSAEEIATAFADPVVAAQFPPLLTEGQAARLLHIPIKTLRNWRSADRLCGLWSKPGRHVLFWRNRLVKWAFDNQDHTWTP